jgi:hemoglobin/transferrin/lactoferrin receptor protein
MPPHLPLIPAIMLATLPVIATAQETAADNAEPAAMAPFDTITVVGTRTERELREVAATVTVKSSEDLERELTRDIADLVRFEPGVSVAGTGSRFGLGGFNIRGIGGNRVLTLIDGVRVPEEFSFGPFLSARRDFVDVDSLDRAEIARGPISSLYGSDALGGVVAFTTKGPRNYLDAGEHWYTGFKAGYSGADDSAVGTLTLASGNELVSGMLLFTRRDGHETDNQGKVGGTGAARERPDPQDTESDNVVAKVSFHPNEAHELQLGVDLLDNDTDTLILSDYGESSLGTVTDRRDAADERRRRRLSLEYRYSGDLMLADRLQATIYRQHAESRQVTMEDRTTAGGAQQSRVRESSFDQDIDGAILQFGKSLELAATSHLVTYGLDYYATDNEGLRDGGTFDATGALVPEFLPLPTRDFPLTEVEQLALFVQDEIGLLNNRLLLSPGLRYDRFDADATTDEVYISGNPGSPPPEDYKDSELTAKIGAVYAISDRFSVFARYSEGFRAPPYGDVNVGFTNFIAGYKTISNPDLESERSSGVEAGIRWQGAAGTVNLATYRNDYENFIESFAIAPDFLPTGGTDPADALLTFQSINRAEVEIGGVELSGSLELDALNEALSGVSMRAAVAWAEGEDRSSGEPINSVEPLTAVLGLRYSPAGDRWGTELLVTVVDSKESGDIDVDNPRSPVPGYGIVDLLAHMNLSESIRLNVGLFNLTDKSYVRWADTAGIGSDAAVRFTQPGFNAGATLRVAW